ncbi:MAG: ABC transporter ATP-binding protein [Thermoanaerobaculales bacterium]|jgi:ABC-2 type transport system ATP-binding protein|nr:ABC transporter ATP-binding protein [Thermoanaerobaculales bacterium]
MSDRTISVRNVSKFYGEVLGVNRVSVEIEPGLTGLVGPNGSGKSTLMHLLCGLLRPTRGEISVLGVGPDEPERLFRLVGYCTQYDSFPNGATGTGFLSHTLALHGYDRAAADRRAQEILERVGLTGAARRRIAGYSKGMRQRIKLAQAICHDPRVLVLDEPLNGLDPMGRAEIIDLFKELARDDRHVIVSSHILHEVDLISDGVVMIHGGSVVAEGAIRDVRGEITTQPLQVLVRCDLPQAIAARAFELEHVVEARIVEDGAGLLLRTTDAGSFFPALTKIILATGAEVETMTPADENVHAVYDYLIGDTGGAT